MDQIEVMKRKKKAIDEVGAILSLFRSFSFGEISDGEFLNLIAKYKGPYPLPSGKWGNILALALELNYYIVAKSIIDYDIFFDINYEQIASDYDGSNEYDIESIIQESALIKMSDEEVSRIININAYSKIKKYVLRNELSFKRLWNKYVNKKNEKVLK